MELLSLHSAIAFGDLTSGGGLAAILDPSTNTGYAQSTSGYAGVTFNSPLPLAAIKAVSADNGFDSSGSTSQITLKAYGNSSATPSNSTDGTLLCTEGPFADVNANTTKTLSISDTTAFKSAWVKLTTGVWCTLSRLQFYAPDYQPPAPDEELAPVFSQVTHCDVPVALLKDGGEISRFRNNVYADAAAVATLNLQMDTVHAKLCGFTEAVMVSAWLAVRTGDTWEGMKAATAVEIPYAKHGGNIVNHAAHYSTVAIQAKVALEAGKYYQFCVFGISATDAAGVSSYDGHAGLVVEAGKGLNSFMVTVNKDEVLI